MFQEVAAVNLMTPFSDLGGGGEEGGRNNL